MIKLLSYNEIDFEKYDACLQNSEQYKYSAEKSFLDITSQKSWCLLVYNNYEAVMPVPFTTKLGLKLVVNPKLCQQLGIFSSSDTIEINDLFLNYFEKKFRIWYYAFNDTNQFSKNLSKRKNYLIEPDLYENVQKKYSPKRKRKLRLEEEVLQNSEILENVNSQDAEVFVRENMLGAEKEKDIEEFLRILKDFHHSKSLLFYGFTYHSKMINIIAIHVSRQSVTLLGTFNDRNFVKIGGSSVLINRAINNYIENKFFDFEGSEIPSVEEFFRGFRPDCKAYSMVKNSKKDLLLKIFNLK